MLTYSQPTRSAPHAARPMLVLACVAVPQSGARFGDGAQAAGVVGITGLATAGWATRLGIPSNNGSAGGAYAKRQSIDAASFSEGSASNGANEGTNSGPPG